MTIRENIDTVRSSRAGHTFHERWAARRALQLIFPKDRLFAIAVEGISSTETATPGAEAEDIADLVLYYGDGDNFRTCERLETLQFKYKERDVPVTASYLKKTIEKFADSLVGYEKDFSRKDVDTKLSFCFVTNAEFSDDLWEAIKALQGENASPDGTAAAKQFRYLTTLCTQHGVDDPSRLFSRTEFRAAEKNLPTQNKMLRRTLIDWSAGADGAARLRLHDLQDLIVRKAGPSGQRNNLLKREDVLDALDCEPEDLFPADTRFIDVGAVVERAELATVAGLIKISELPMFIHANGGVGKTVFIQSLAAISNDDFEVVVFDCFGGGSYRSDDQARHLPKIGLIQIANELASRGLCDPLLPGDSDRIGLTKAARRRLNQAAKTVKDQSNKCGILIILDAADNAQLEADYRKEDAFPKLLLSSLNDESIDGVKLVLTARTHRMASVVDRATVQPFELGPFTETEARLFLESRRATLSNIEFAIALARSGRNARVLDYLVQTWEFNVLNSAPQTEITVEEIIAQKCEKIFADLRTTGWTNAEIREFFAAISLLPPPIPLDELANALSWSTPQIASAASDLAPMLEVVPHGAIFRDEPTETYVRETYSGETNAQQAIAQRLQDSQSTSFYAAETLPHLLVTINDSDRAFALADSKNFPTTVQSDFGRRRLMLARLYAAFRLAVNSGDYDRVLGLTMRLAQVAAANTRGDQFIRRSPALAVMLGDRDAYRRLFNDRSGWRGARSARLTIAHSFAGEVEEAEIQCDRTIGWINWHSQSRKEDETHEQSGPDVTDFAAVMFENVVRGGYASVDKNLSRWNCRFALSASNEVIELAWQLGRYSKKPILDELAIFTASAQSTSFELKVSLLARPLRLDKGLLKSLSRSAAAVASSIDPESLKYDSERQMESDVVQAALTALLRGSRTSASRILKVIPDIRPSSHDYSERHGPSRIWLSVFHCCLKAWASSQRISYHHLLPRGVKVSRQAKALSNNKDLITFLGQLKKPLQSKQGRNRSSQTPEPLFDDRERREICSGIALILAMVEPIEAAVLAGNGISSECWTSFLSAWRTRLRTELHWRAEEPADVLCRTVGLGLTELLLNHVDAISEVEAKPLLELISNDRFAINQKTNILALMAERPALHDLTGSFARHITEHIGRDDYIEQRGKSYAELATSLMAMSIEEAREYYRQGLSQLDQMGSDDYDQIYSLLHYAAEQQGGAVRPELAQRLMNLCQTIAHSEPSKFGWALFGRAAANSIGLPAVHKLLRWDDQDVANYSYGLPQLACFLVKKGALDARRAAFLLIISKDHGWHEWQLGDGLRDLLEAAEPTDRRPIFVAVFNKLKAEHTSGAWPSLWKSLLELGSRFPSVVTDEDRCALKLLATEAEHNRDEYNNRNNSSAPAFATAKPKDSEATIDERIAQLAMGCDFSSAVNIDTALRALREDQSLPYDARSRFLTQLRKRCSYDKRLGFLFAVCEASEFELDDAIDLIENSVTEWKSSSAHLVANTQNIVERLFEFKGSQLFDLRFSRICRHIKKLSDFCGDSQFVLSLVLQTVSQEQLDLNGDEWLQLATSLCEQTSPHANVAALESFLSGPALRIADEVGEGLFRPEFTVSDDQPKFLAGIIWHLLGDDDAYVRWAIARALKTLSDLGLDDDLKALLNEFDQTQIVALSSSDAKLSFQNSQQWLLMGLARATYYHGPKLECLRSGLLALASRSDIHVVNKLHIARCLENIRDKTSADPDLEALRNEINIPTHGFVISDDWPEPMKSQSGFHFDYEFNKTEVSGLARLFGISEGRATDAMAVEIKKRWPEATDLDYFPGRARYQRESDDRYEFYREHIQRHALIRAAGSLASTLPIVVSSYESRDQTPWAEWLDRYDTTFTDGTWLSDRKDAVPRSAKAFLLGPRDGNQETLKDQETLLNELGLMGFEDSAFLPIYADWTSPDGVYVRIVSALSTQRGAIGECERFSKRSSHDLWLPQFWDEGYYDQSRRQSNPFDPFIWAPDAYGLGIDVGDEIAARGAAARPRLGIELTEILGIASDFQSAEWRTKDGRLALKSQVWGRWEPDPDQHRYHSQNDGNILWADPIWLDRTLTKFGKRLVYTITFWKHRSSRDYDERTGVKAVFMGLRLGNSKLRVWAAKKASVPSSY